MEQSEGGKRVNRLAYEVCVLLVLRERLCSKEVWVKEPTATVERCARCKWVLVPYSAQDLSAHLSTTTGRRMFGSKLITEGVLTQKTDKVRFSVGCHSSRSASASRTLQS